MAIDNVGATPSARLSTRRMFAALVMAAPFGVLSAQTTSPDGADSPSRAAVEVSASKGRTGPLIFPSSLQFDLADANYFLFGFDKGYKTGNRSDLDYSNQVKFRVSVRYRLIKGKTREDLNGVYATYTQNSFWHLYDPSAPFFDNNYNPGLLGVLTLKELGDVPIAVFSGVNHESTGRSGALSRGWNRIPFGLSVGRQGLSTYWADLRFWRTFGVEDSNPDITKFAGSGEFRVGVNAKATSSYAWRVDLRTRLTNGLRAKNLEVNAATDLPYVNRWIATQVHAQYFTGYAESLLMYNRRTESFRLGLSLLR